jgi:TRAP-type C4-dicarboxylate transport system permease small subunit
MRSHNVFGTVIAAIEWLITALLLVIFLLTATLVILRYLFNASILGGTELVSFMFIYTTALGAAAAIPKNRHIRITFFIDHLPDRLRLAAEAFVLLCIALINGAMVFYSLDWIATVGSDVSQSLGIPLGIVKASVPIGCGLAVIFALYSLVEVFRRGAPLQKEGAL